MNARDRILFLRYALPCAGTLVKRGSTTQGNVDRLVSKVSRNIAPEDGSEKIFVVANAMCRAIARQMGKKSVDADVIRKYFLLEHSKVVDERFELMKDFSPAECRTYPGRIVSMGAGSAIVETPRGRKKYRTILAKGIKNGDIVSVHYDFVIEKIDGQTEKKMRRASHEE
jgi:hydrogenase maturation factor